MQKLSHAIADSWVPYSHKAVFSVSANDLSERILAGVPGGDPTPFVHLVSCLEPPYFLLYVLHTPRGEGEPGRYQSPAMSQQQFHEFVQRFGNFLSSDARFDIWAHSSSDQATVVWDRHNQIFAYGPIDRYSSELRALGFVHGDASISFAHQHHYRHECDADASALLNSMNWSHSPLRPEDEQRL
ncbi:hypothetical protein HNP55_002758 [Paucibacter oligotrophus]|uniref:Uncharacterized protein n=1 Tax=Roseateles oligotrophus TaxID=1769250 RepID=A0A840LC41_9BURK|nr:hypothetical protein [Roseateles oligotrophus]MBB4844222.1 hypothetical protein [Roseateles oligotrophus]